MMKILLEEDIVVNEDVEYSFRLGTSVILCSSGYLPTFFDENYDFWS